jgi:DNA-binding MarR family transcriptional regulator
VQGTASSPPSTVLVAAYAPAAPPANRPDRLRHPSIAGQQRRPLLVWCKQSFYHVQVPTPPTTGSGADAAVDTTIGDIEQALTRLFRRGNQPRVHEQLIARAGVALDRAAYAVVSRLSDCGPVRLSELAYRMGVDVSTACRQVQALEQAGLVTRTVDPADRRATLLRLSEEGTLVLGRVREVRRAQLAKALRAWPAEDRRQFATLLDRMLDDFDALMETGS